MTASAAAMAGQTVPTLRPYQLDALALLDEAFAIGRRAPLLVLPTGSGKTVIAAEIMRRVVGDGGRALFLAPRRELIYQTSEKLNDVGLEHGVVLAGADSRAGSFARAQVASVDTLLSRMMRRGRLVLPAYTHVLVDEAHLSITLPRQRLLEHWPEALRIGLTATPTRKDGRALGVLYDAIIEPATPATLTAEGYLVPARYFSWPTPDLSGVRITAGDYQADTLDAAMNQPRLLGDIVEHWCVHAPGRRSVVFATSIAHAIALADTFRRHGIAAEHVDAGTPPEQRAQTFKRFRCGETQVLTNCFLAAYGFDLPVLSCVVLARPTKSLMLYLQMLGRGLRPADGKENCMVLDHAGAVHEHGFAADERHWTLRGRYALEPAPRHAGKAPKIRTCPECAATFAGLTCPECGYHFALCGKMVETIDGQLVELGAGLTEDALNECAWFAELRGYAALHEYRPGWAAHKFREKFDRFPPWAWNAGPVVQPSAAMLGWITSRAIAWARRRRGEPQPLEAREPGMEG